MRSNRINPRLGRFIWIDAPNQLYQGKYHKVVVIRDETLRTRIEEEILSQYEMLYGEINDEPSDEENSQPNSQISQEESEDDCPF